MLNGRGLEDLRSWVLAHHERPDGKGYPAGLTDAEIPLEAKILAVADAYEAMTADRVYRAGHRQQGGSRRAAALRRDAVRRARDRRLHGGARATTERERASVRGLEVA